MVSFPPRPQLAEKPYYAARELWDQRVESAVNDVDGWSAGRLAASAGTRFRSLASVGRLAAPVSAIIGMHPDGVRKVVTNASFSASQIGVTDDFSSFEWGKNLTGGAGIATGFVMTAGGEALVSVRYRDNSPGVIFRSTGFDPATMDAASWSIVLTASKPLAHFDGRWGLTQRSVSAARSAASGAIFVAEYDGNRAWMSVDDGASWTVIFDLQVVRPGATHVHAIAYDPFDDRVWVSVGDTAFAGVYYTDREAIVRGSNVWAPLAGSLASSWQVTTIVPLPLGVVMLSDSNTSGVVVVGRVGSRGYAAPRRVVTVPGVGLIGAHAFQASSDDPAYFTFYQSGAGQTPRVFASVDGVSVREVFASSSTTSSGPGVHSVYGPDARGDVWMTENLTGAGEVLRLRELPDGAPAVRSGAAVRRGLLAHTGPEDFYASTSTNLVDGTVYLMKVVAEDSAGVSPRFVRVFQEGAASGVVSWTAAVFSSDGVRLGVVSPSDSGASQTHRDFAVGSFAVEQGREYYIALLFKGASGPSLARSSASVRVRAGLSGRQLLWATAGAGLADMPSSFNPSTVGPADIGLWAGLL